VWPEGGARRGKQTGRAHGVGSQKDLNQLITREDTQIWGEHQKGKNAEIDFKITQGIRGWGGRKGEKKKKSGMNLYHRFPLISY